MGMKEDNKLPDLNYEINQNIGILYASFSVGSILSGYTIIIHYNLNWLDNLLLQYPQICIEITMVTIDTTAIFSKPISK
jgi:hypothetical protein